MVNEAPLKPRKELELLGFQPKGDCYGGCGCKCGRKSYFAMGHDAAFAYKVEPYLRALVNGSPDETAPNLVKAWSGTPELKRAVQRLNKLPEDT